MMMMMMMMMMIDDDWWWLMMIDDDWWLIHSIGCHCSAWSYSVLFVTLLKSYIDVDKTWQNHHWYIIVRVFHHGFSTSFCIFTGYIYIHIILLHFLTILTSISRSPRLVCWPWSWRVGVRHGILARLSYSIHSHVSKDWYRKMWNYNVFCKDTLF